jgi:flagellar biosynthesis component FlhA
MSLVFATQLTAIATLALAALALATAILALLAWRKQSREVSDQAEMLRLQAAELERVSAEREREAQERHRAQAVQVYMWVTLDNGAEMVAHVRNTSGQPIYEVMLQSRADGSARMWAEPLMPGTEVSDSYDLKSPHLLEDITLTFRDRAHVRWEIWPDGQLEELPGPPSPAKISIIQTPPRAVQ